MSETALVVRGTLVCMLFACSVAWAAPRQPVELVRWEDPTGIVTASGPELVVYTATTIAALPRAGGPARTLVTLEDGIGALTDFAPGIPRFYVQDAQSWFTREGTRLLRIPKAGGATEILAVAAGPIGTLAVDDKALYSNVGGALLRLDLE